MFACFNFLSKVSWSGTHLVFRSVCIKNRHKLYYFSNLNSSVYFYLFILLTYRYEVCFSFVINLLHCSDYYLDTLRPFGHFPRTARIILISSILIMFSFHSCFLFVIQLFFSSTMHVRRAFP